MIKNQLSKPSTFVSTVRCDARDMAIIAQFLAMDGEILASRATLARAGLTMCANMIRAKFPDLEPADTSNALAILDRYGYSPPKSETRNRRTILETLSAEDLMTSGASPVQQTTITADQISNAMKSVENADEADARRAAELAEVKRAMKLGGNIPVADDEE